MRPKHAYRLDPSSGAFIVENYNWAPPFHNFLPGIAGPWGVPLWLYYVNRGQAVSSAGVKDKNGQMLEFYSFNKACARIAREGFRTFLRADGGRIEEAFIRTPDRRVRQRLTMTAAEIRLFEENTRIGLAVEVSYFTLANMPQAGLVREVTVRNLTRKKRRVEILDGHPRVLPFGLNQASIKGIPRHIEAMMGVAYVDGVPVVRLKQTAEDSEKVGLLSGGHFFLHRGAGCAKRAIVDPEVIFGEAFEYDGPWKAEGDRFVDLTRRPGYPENKTPCAFAAAERTLGPGQELRLASVLGFVRADEEVRCFLRQWNRPDFLEEARRISVDAVERVSDLCFTASAEPSFDAYCRQDFLDNVIRGGLPYPLKTRSGLSPLYIYSRQNGDLERDYHFFVLDPTYLSQGTGHYRSVLQNRRTDTWFFPDILDANLKLFLDLVQLDGYNPLEVKGLTYRVADKAGFARWLRPLVKRDGDRKGIEAMVSKSFTPGEFAMKLETLAPRIPREQIVSEALSFCVENEVGGLHEGFWADHWHYNIDLIDVFLMIHPDRLEELLFRSDYSFFDDPDVIVPRDGKEILTQDGRVRRYGAVRRDPGKLKAIQARERDAYRVRTRNGKGDVFRTSLLVKLLTIVTNRLAALDPSGMGVDMEAGKPGWNDSMNGLPGLFGSGLSETSELARTIRLLRRLLADLSASERRVEVFDELAIFMAELGTTLKRRNARAGDAAALVYWNESNRIKEQYRARTFAGVSGKTRQISIAEIDTFLALGQKYMDRLFSPANRKDLVTAQGVPHTYFVHDATRWRATGRKNHLGLATVDVARFKRRPAGVFLEGAVHWMKDRPEEARAVYRAVRRSELFDRKLRMYRASGNMSRESFELGRAVGAYPRGWCENESIYLHMEFKYLLEMLRAGLCDEFWRDARTTLMPFLDPAVYKRSTLEGASFIVSSAYADRKYHGQAFQPRLSGITVEFLHLWVLSVAGPAPFRMDPGPGLVLQLEPRLPGWLFTKQVETRRYCDPMRGWTEIELPKNSFAFKFLGHTLVVYRNPERFDTWKTRPAAYRVFWRNGREEIFGPAGATRAKAAAIRDGQAERIDVTLSGHRP